MEAGNNGAHAPDLTKKSPSKSFYRRIKALSPIPYLVKARDYYVRSISECAGRANYSGLASGGLGVSVSSSLPKSFSTSSSRYEDEYSELVRAASQKSSPGFSRNYSSAAAQPPFPRSFSASTAPSVGRIDEDRPAYFPGSFNKSASVAQGPDPRYPRSRSCSTAPQNLALQRRIAV